MRAFIDQINIPGGKVKKLKLTLSPSMVDTSAAEYDDIWLAEYENGSSERRFALTFRLAKHEHGLSKKKVCLPSMINSWLAEYE